MIQKTATSHGEGCGLYVHSVPRQDCEQVYGTFRVYGKKANLVDKEDCRQERKDFIIN